MPRLTDDALQLQQQLLCIQEHIDSLLRQQQRLVAQLVGLCCEPVDAG
jgi:hypothetical protein